MQNCRKRFGPYKKNLISQHYGTVKIVSYKRNYKTKSFDFFLCKTDNALTPLDIATEIGN